jgi:hypothetical protein
MLASRMKRILELWESLGELASGPGIYQRENLILKTLKGEKFKVSDLSTPKIRDLRKKSLRPARVVPESE